MGKGGNAANEEPEEKNIKVAEELSPKAILTAASKSKNKYQEATMSCQGILSSVGAEAEWCWADNPAILTPMQAARKDLEINTTSFANEFFMTELATLRRRYEASKLLALLQKLSLGLDARIEKLEYECKLLVSMHSSRGVRASPLKTVRAPK